MDGSQKEGSMSDQDLQERNRLLADWTIRLDATMSLVTDGSGGNSAALLAAWANLNAIRKEMQEIAIPTDQRDRERQAA